MRKGDTVRVIAVPDNDPNCPACLLGREGVCTTDPGLDSVFVEIDGWEYEMMLSEIEPV